MQESDNDIEKLIASVREKFTLSGMMQPCLFEFLRQPDLCEDADYLRLCHSIHSLIMEDAMKILPVIMLVECNLLKVGKRLQYADCILRWLVECKCELAQKGLLSEGQLLVIEKWIMIIAKEGTQDVLCPCTANEIAEALSAVRSLGVRSGATRVNVMKGFQK